MKCAYSKKEVFTDGEIAWNVSLIHPFNILDAKVDPTIKLDVQEHINWSGVDLLKSQE